MRISPSSAGASSTTSAHSSAGWLTDALAGAGFARSSEQPAQLLHGSACAAQQVRLVLIRAQHLGSLGTEAARVFALTPSPSPTGWERGVGANGGSPSPAV